MEMAVLESSDSKKVMVEPDNEKDFKKLVDNSKPGYSTNVVAKEDTWVVSAATILTCAISVAKLGTYK